MTEYIFYSSDQTNKIQNENSEIENCSGRGLLKLIDKIDNPIGVEIGSDVGHTTFYLLNGNKNLYLTCIDPYINYMDWNGNNLNERNTAFDIFKNRISKFSDRVNHIRKTSDDAVEDIKDESLDFIFIDGLHTYDQVKKDMENYYSKVKSGGIFAGHDYRVIEEVNKAVNEFASLCGKTVLETDRDVWYWYK